MHRYVCMNIAFVDCAWRKKQTTTVQETSSNLGRLFNHLSAELAFTLILYFHIPLIWGQNILPFEKKTFCFVYFLIIVLKWFDLMRKVALCLYQSIMIFPVVPTANMCLGSYAFQMRLIIKIFFFSTTLHSKVLSMPQILFE